MSGQALGLLGGWLLDAAAGDPVRVHPVAVFGAAAERLEAAWWRDDRLAGAAYTAALVGAPTAAFFAADRWLARAGRRRARGLLLAAVTWTALGGRSLGREALAVGAAVAAGDLEGARRRLPALCGRDPAALDGAGLCRAAIESVAENTADAVVAPLLWAAAGPAGVVAHRCANTLDAMVGHRSPRHARFGWASARLDDAAAWLPARLTVALAAACAPAVGGSPRAVVGATARDGGRHPSPNAGRCEAAFAGALGVRLGGPCRYGERLEIRGPFGDGPSPGPADVERAVRLSAAVGAVAVLLAAAAGLLATVAVRAHATASHAAAAARLTPVAVRAHATAPHAAVAARLTPVAVRAHATAPHAAAAARPRRSSR